MRPGGDSLWLASGEAFPDALTAAVGAHRAGGSLSLINPADLARSPEVGDFVQQTAAEIDDIMVVGGEMAISDRVAQQVDQAANQP